MSSYLTFYLVPKKSKTKYVRNEETDETEEQKIQLSQEPLSLMYYCRSSEIYQAFYENLHPAYAGKEDKYSELTYRDAKYVCEQYEDTILRTKKRLDSLYKIIKEKYDPELVDEIMSAEEYLSDCKETLNILENISRIVYEVTTGYGDFEKVLINID